VGIAAHGIFAQADASKNHRRAHHAVSSGEAGLVNGERLGNDFADAHPRIERGEGILKNHLHLAALGAQFFPAERKKITPLEMEFTAVGLDQAHEHGRQCCFSAAAFADDGKRLSARD